MMSTPPFRIGDCVRLLNHRGRVVDTRVIERIEYDERGTLWAGFLRTEDAAGIHWFHVSEHRMAHRRPGDE